MLAVGTGIGPAVVAGFLVASIVSGDGPLLGLGLVPLSTIGVTEVSCRGMNQTTVAPRRMRGIPMRSVVCNRIRGDPLGCSAVLLMLELAEVSCTRFRVWSRSLSGAGMNIGAPPSRATGLTCRRCSCAHVWHDSMCRAMRLRMRTVSCPSQPLRIATSSGHAFVLARASRATSSAPRERSTVWRSRNIMVFALVRVTPRASASSGPSNPCR